MAKQDTELLQAFELIVNRFAKPALDLYEDAKAFVELRQNTTELQVLSDNLKGEVAFLKHEINAEKANVTEAQTKLKQLQDAAQKQQEEADIEQQRRTQEHVSALKARSTELEHFKNLTAESVKLLNTRKQEETQASQRLQEIQKKWEQTQQRLIRDQDEIQQLKIEKEQLEGKITTLKKQYDEFIQGLGALK